MRKVLVTVAVSTGIQKHNTTHFQPVCKSSAQQCSQEDPEWDFKGPSTKSVLPDSSPESRHVEQERRSGGEEPEIELPKPVRGYESYQMSRGNTCSSQGFGLQVSSHANFVSTELIWYGSIQIFNSDV